jgi:hypothetical protein
MRPVLRRMTILGAIAVAGCGGSDEQAADTQTTTTPPPTTAAPASQTTPKSGPDRGRPQVVAKEKRRLERAGLEPKESGIAGVPGAQAGLETPLKGGGGLTVIKFDDAAAAEKKADEFRPLAKKYPDYFRVEVRGTTVYLGVAEQPQKLSKDGFSDAVKAATATG